MLNFSDEGAQSQRRYCSVLPARGAQLERYIHSVYEFIKAKKLAAVRIGTIKIRPEALEDFIKSSEVQPWNRESVQAGGVLCEIMQVVIISPLKWFREISYETKTKPNQGVVTILAIKLMSIAHFP